MRIPSPFAAVLREAAEILPAGKRRELLLEAVAERTAPRPPRLVTLGADAVLLAWIMRIAGELPEQLEVVAADRTPGENVWPAPAEGSVLLCPQPATAADLLGLLIRLRRRSPPSLVRVLLPRGGADAEFVWREAGAIDVLRDVRDLPTFLRGLRTDAG